MSRRRGVMSESFKNELAKDLGFYDVVQREGWEGIRTKDAGNMVKRAIQIAEEQLAKQYSTSAPSAQTAYGQPNYTQPSYTQASTYNQQVVQTPQYYGQQTVSATPAHMPSNTQNVHPSSMSNGSAHTGWNPMASASQQAAQINQRPYYS
ncbi:small acid-soluble spore protein F (minor alpha/beta-type SASP) [Paenibacillus aceris]|uniref:Small acid-soluble spore protein F (Minor alpha/beta-type SASP) n=1 Tax=Paenibacillus aceris TaxID=869555 RepID=A0ABS4I8E3_9BACL|nr:small acid-soluble spore protein F (minor alpha/beta-type SASP) [Paenibacillus aceris]